MNNIIILHDYLAVLYLFESKVFMYKRNKLYSYDINKN